MASLVSRKIAFFLIIVSLVFSMLSSFVQPGYAVDGVEGTETLETNPKTRSAKVTASVRDHILPTVPILIFPENGSLISDATPTFVWEESYDALGIDYYQLYIDGSLFADNLLATPSATSTYRFTQTGTQYSLELLQGLSDGLHTWKVRVFDNNANYVDSATWSFTIDSTAPTIIVTAIGDLAVSITSQDASTVPITPYELSENSVTISGSAEANASLTLTYTVEGESPKTLTTTADSAGGFSFTLPILPREKKITIQILATDAAGNTSVIDGVLIIIKEQLVTLPLPSPYKAVVPKIPVSTIEELRENIIETLKDIGKIVEQYVPIPEEVKEFVAVSSTIAMPLLNSFIGAAIPVGRIAIAIWLMQAPIWLFSLKTLLRTLQTLGLLPHWLFPVIPPLAQHVHGVVFDAATYQPVPFALITVLKKPRGEENAVQDEKAPEIAEEVVTDDLGRYEVLDLDPSSSYRLQFNHKDYVFDQSHASARFFGSHEVYVGQELSSTLCETEKGDHSSKEDYGVYCFPHALLVALLIPMERKEIILDPAQQLKPVDVEKVMHKVTKRYWYTHLSSKFLGIITSLMAITAFFSPTPWNVGMTGLYAVITVRKAFRNTRKHL